MQRFTSPKEKGKRSEGKEGAPSACKLAMCDITGPICIDATGSVAVDVDSCSLTAQVWSAWGERTLTLTELDLSAGRDAAHSRILRV